MQSGSSGAGSPATGGGGGYHHHDNHHHHRRGAGGETTKAKHNKRKTRKRRRFEEIRCCAVGSQPQSDRFPKFDDYVETRTPPVQRFRNNLTALSHRYNLYFVACDDRINVYRPGFPEQRLSKCPLLLLDWPSTGYERGVFANASPSSVNNIVVSNLGGEEVLLLACDDGAVVAFYVKLINDAVSIEDEYLRPNIRPFFYNDVGESAWGLAIHTQARLIAVSCNAKFVYVFAFGLNADSAPALAEYRHERRDRNRMSDGSEDGGVTLSTADESEDDDYLNEGKETKDDVDDDGNADGDANGQHGLSDDEDMADLYESSGGRAWIQDDYGWDSALSSKGWKQAFRERKRNVVLRCARFHSANIPSVAFCNTPDDPGGHYLASTDIDGCTSVINIENGRQACRYLQPTHPHVDEIAAYDRRRAGWALAWLDRRAFCRAADAEQCWGGLEEPRQPKYPQPLVVNTTSTRSHVRNKSDFLRLPSNEMRHQEASLPEAEFSDSQTDDDDYYDEENNDDNDDGNDDETILSAATPLIQPRPNEFDDDLDALNAFTLERLDEAVSNAPSHPVPREGEDQSDGEDDATQFEDLLDIAELRNRYANFLPQHLEHYHSSPALTLECRKSTREQDQHLSTPLPSCPFLHIMERSVHLFQSADFWSAREPAAAPIFFLDDPLAQLTADERLGFEMSNVDRMNLFVQIPELGVVLLGSGKGRVAVLTLHQLADNRWNPAGLEPLYAFRLDWLLPFNAQEESCERPIAPLVGLAAAPVQGYEDTAGARPWRVMLHYRDHTVLSYEIGGLGEDKLRMIL